ncbi:MAG: tRNA 2-selenouridine(34) synthase MnmH [Oceanicaulis sp.]|nr:tRNA 2-selenouridine(34) synthase MnmH [Oceanicaulis sp.]
MTRVAPETLADFAALGADEIIDVRSPGEYAQDHMPGALSLPVLNDDERARVGTIYVQEDPFLARKIGAALVARNTADHIEKMLSDRPGGWRPLVYCWRGGQRSRAFATILSEIGWRVSVLDGGYQRYRRAVRQRVYDAPFPAPLILIDGDTGAAKTAVLDRVRALGGQVIDLEGLANHRGSLFGALTAPQPSQKAFESALAAAIDALDPARPVLVEAESSKIGARILPPALWSAMADAPRLVSSAPLEARAAYLARAYGDIADDPARLAALIERLQPFHARALIEEWRTLAADGALEALAASLMAEHYDPSYARQRTRFEPHVRGRFETQALDAESIDALARAVLEAMGG